MRIVIDDKIPFVQGVFEPIADVVYAPGACIDAAMVKDADALMVRTRTQCNAELLQSSKVRLITTATIGYDHIDRDYCAEHDITWVNAPGCNAYAVVQYVFAALAVLEKRQNLDLTSLTLGIVGVGNVGSRVAAFAAKLGMRVLLNDPPRADREGAQNFVSLDCIKREADIVTFHTPLTQGGVHPSYHLCGNDFLVGLERCPILINAARGEVMDTMALLRHKSTYSALVVDCWENEPELNSSLLEYADIATFHIAGYSMEGKANAAIASVHAISRFFNLGMDDWKVDLPLQAHEEQLPLLEIVEKSYPIEVDDKALREQPAQFEYLRGSYNYRREPVCLY